MGVLKPVFVESMKDSRGNMKCYDLWNFLSRRDFSYLFIYFFQVVISLVSRFHLYLVYCLLSHLGKPGDGCNLRAYVGDSAQLVFI